MRRSKVDVVRAQAAVDAVRSGAMSYRVASEAYSISVSSIAKRLKGKVRMDASVGAGTVLTLEEENSLEDALIWAAHRHLGVGRLELKQAVTKLCNDGRLVPWDRVNGPGRKWLDLFLRRHPRLSERSCRIYEANRISLNYLIEIPAAYCRQIVISVIDFVYKTSVCRMVGLKFLRGSAVG